MSQGVSDEAIVAMKQTADENAVTYLRVKLFERDRTSKAKGGTCKQVGRSQILKLSRLRHGKKTLHLTEAAQPPKPVSESL